MQVTIWHHVDQAQPTRSGEYFAVGRHDILGTRVVDYYWWNNRRRCWAESKELSKVSGHYCAVLYWTENDPATWPDQPTEHNDALADAADQLQQALDRYEMIQSLTN
jgi:hypothetical protein